MITEYGRAKVLEAMDNAINRERFARHELDAAVEGLDAMREAMECNHEDLEDVEGANLLTQTRCNQCGFIWYDEQKTRT